MVEWKKYIVLDKHERKDKKIISLVGLHYRTEATSLDSFIDGSHVIMASHLLTCKQERFHRNAEAHKTFKMLKEALTALINQ